MKIGATVVCLLTLLPAAFAGPQRDGVYTPKPGTTERKAVLDSLRKPVVKEMSQTVIFTYVTMNIKEGWAYVKATGTDTKGKPLKKLGGQYFPFQALLRKQGKAWQVLSWGYGGGTDATDNAMTKYPQAPREIFLPYTGPGATQ